MKITCYNCQHQFELETQFVGRKEECPSCYADIHSCKACHFYDKSSYNECREPTADRIVEKEKANFCDHFKLSTGTNTKEDSANDPLKAAEALFKK